MNAPAATRGAPRLPAVDVLRGMVVLLLIPNPSGGFSFRQMAELHPDRRAWRWLADTFTHTAWQGATLWDLVMPLFVFVVGVSMALSHDAHMRAGADRAQRALRAVLRSATLVVLGLLVTYGQRSTFDEPILLLVIAATLPWTDRRGADASRAGSMIHLGVRVATLVLALVWMFMHPQRMNDVQLHQILVLLGLAYLPAYFLQALRPAAQWAAAAAIVAGHAALHAGYAWAIGLTSAADSMRETVALAWLKGSNVAGAVDLLLLNLLPRELAYTGQAQDYHTLQFLPLIALMLIGAQVGRSLAGGMPRRRFLAGCLAWAAASLAFSALLAGIGIPLVKILWTPTWTFFSVAVCLLATALVVWGVGSGARLRLAAPLVVLGSNALLLYVIASTERWRIVGVAKPLLDLPAAAPWRPLLESLWVLAVLWLGAWWLYRRGLALRV